MEDKIFQHPEGKIHLLDSRILDCSPLEQPQDEVDNQLALDTTGVYLSLRKLKKADTVKIRQDDEEKEMKKLFLENAFVFLENRERILSDSRMFLCPVPIQNGLAYTGISGFRHPTLGIYIEFWKACPYSNIMEKDGKKWLLWHIAGSPLSGSNRCSLVNPQGETKYEQVTPFKDIWRPFMEINTRYDKAKWRYEAYTLREVLAIFEREGCKVTFRKNTHIFFLEQANRQLKREIQNLRAYSNQLYGKYRHHLLNEKRKELEAFIAEYHTKCDDVRDKITMIHVQRMELRKQMREGVIDNLQYQRLWKPIHKEKKEIQAELVRFEQNTLREMIPDFSVSASEVERFLKGECISNNRL
jgi:hypothetical protein